MRHWSAAAGEDLKRRWLWIVLRHEIDYRDPILPGDHVDGRALLGRADGPRYDRFVDLRRPRAGRPAAAVKSTWVLVEAASRKPKRVSAEIFEAFGVSG